MSQLKQFTLLLLYEKSSSALPVAQALKEKEIDVHVVQNAGELIQSIASKKTDMVALSANHPSTVSLIRVLQDKTKVQIMVFGEDKHPSTINKIDKLPVDIKISGIANGYNIYMKIGHLVKKTKTNDAAGTIKLTGGGERKIVNKKKKQAFIVKGKIKSKKQRDEESSDNVIAVGGIDSAHTDEDGEQTDEELLHQLDQEMSSDESKAGGDLGDEADHEIFDNAQSVIEIDNESGSEANETAYSKTIVFEDGVKPGNRGSIVQKGGGKMPPGALLFRKKNEVQKKGHIIRKVEDESGNGSVATKAATPRPLGVGGTIVFSDEALLAAKKFEESEEFEMNLGDVTTLAQMIKEERPSNVIDFKSQKKKMPKDASVLEAGKAAAKEKYEEYRAQKKAVVKPEPIEPLAKLRHRKQFKDAVLKAGEDSFQKNIPVSENVGVINKVSVVPVDNPKEKGFLLFCSNENQYLSPEQVDKFKARLNKEMDADGTGDFALGKKFDIETFNVDICQWAETYSQFFYNFTEEETGNEIVVCFLKRENVYPDHKKMDELGGVYRVHIQNMPPLLPLNFNVFLYFMKNKRLIPYLKKGGTFTSLQIQRLYKRGFKFLYIPAEDKDEFFSFYISLSINQDFQSLNASKLA